MVLWLMDAAPSRVQCLLRSFTNLVESESNGSINIELSSGGIASLAFSMTSHIARRSTLVIGTEGTLLIEDGKAWVNDKEIQVDESEETFVRQMREFVNAIREDREPIASGRDVLPVMAVLDAAKESSRTGNAVKL